jgi:hypothetical protein
LAASIPEAAMSACSIPPSSLFDRILEAATFLAARLVKDRARRFAVNPLTLEAIFPGLANADPDTMIDVGLYLLAGEKKNPRRWFGFGGEVPALNAKAVVLLGRARRRLERRSFNHFPQSNEAIILKK